MKFQSMGGAEFNTAYFNALWFYEVDGLVQERRNSISNALEMKTLSARGVSCVLDGCSHNLLDKHSSGRWAEIP